MPVAAVAAAAVVGGAAGSQKDKTTQSGISGTVQQMQVADAGPEELKARGIALDSVVSLEKRLKQLESSPVLANLDKLLLELGQGPSAERLASSRQFAEDVFAPQQAQLQQSLEDQQRQFAARAAQQGRSTTDPILAAKLAQEQIRQQQSLSAEKGSFAAQEAINAPVRQFQNQLGGLAGLGEQAIQNRQAVFALGSEFANTQMNFRLASAGRTSTTNTAQDQQSGGGFKGFTQGLFGGAGAGLKAFGAGG